MLQVVMGIVFVLLLLSLLATTVMELLASLLKLRGRNLEKALRNMLSEVDTGDEIFEKFKSNALFRQLSYKFSKETRPSYLSDDSFQSILFDVILNGEQINLDNLKTKIEELPNEDLKKVLRQLLNDAQVKAEDKLEAFRKEVKTWYNDIMDRASGWYKRNTQKLLIVIGLAIALIFNADTLAIYERLESDPAALQQVVTLAEDFVSRNDVRTLERVDPEFQENYNQLKTLVHNQLESVKSPLGLGWKNVDMNLTTPYDWATKILGWIVTALAISLGAPFWFDLLRKIVNLRSSGNKPGE
jgi:rubrerythrin